MPERLAVRLRSFGVVRALVASEHGGCFGSSADRLQKMML
jgi:hypothetical protein